MNEARSYHNLAHTQAHILRIRVPYELILFMLSLLLFIMQSQTISSRWQFRILILAFCLLTFQAFPYCPPAPVHINSAMLITRKAKWQL